ncbi:hypothetical protein [Vibrio gallicus]|uniref:hypothetical protein n=1 Tax=Vibrio gallicus TaxID=190897 RepID=UPI0021C2F8CC|nr:hypothetical protein [Vibrio gallicus]
MKNRILKRAIVGSTVVGFMLTIGVSQSMAQAPVSDPLLSLTQLSGQNLSGETSRNVTIDGVEYLATETYKQTTELQNNHSTTQLVRNTVETITLQPLDLEPEKVKMSNSR